LDGQAEIQKQLSQIVEMLRPAYEEGSLQLAKSAPATQIAADNEPVSNSLEKHLRDQIDTYRELSRNGRPKTAIELLTRLKDKVWDNASPRVRFRLLANIAARCISSPNSTWHKPGTKADWEMSAQTVRRKRS
jgi:hypothetical protein